MTPERKTRCNCPVCIMCHGTKVYPYGLASGAVVWFDCAACQGTGIEHEGHS